MPRIICHHHKLSDRDRDFIEEKVGKLKKYFERISEVSVILDAAGNDSQAEILVLGPQVNIRVHSVNESMQAAFETALNKAERSLRKTKDKLFDKKSRRRNVTIRRFTPEELAEEPEDSNEESLAKIPIDHIDPEVMTLAEAREKLDRVKEDLVVFVNPKTDEINLLHHNRNGKVELVELNGTLLYHPSDEVIELAGNQ
jgi:putative sigma-54 modulation protein